jgi:hypothetical protein
MKRTILIGIQNTYYKKANNWVLVLSGSMFVTGGVYYMMKNHSFWLILGIMWTSLGLYHLFNGILSFNSIFAPKVKVDEGMIELKNSIWKPAKILYWKDVSSINFNSYEVVFQLKNSSNTFSYNTTSDVSREIKQTIREIAELKNIQITGG